MQPFMRRPKRMLLGVALAALCLAFNRSWGGPRARSINACVRFTGCGRDARPQRLTVDVRHLLGSVDRQRVARPTASQHVVGDAAEARRSTFPPTRDGATIPELAHYHRQVAAVYGRVVHREMRRDRALLQLDALPGRVSRRTGRWRPA